MPTASPTEAIFRSKVETLLGLLNEQLARARRLLELSRRRVHAAALARWHVHAECLDLAREALEDHALVERERLACLQEIGEILGIPQPASLRIAKLVLHVDPEQRDELLEVRELLRDVADDLESLRLWGHRLEHHRSGRLTVYLVPEVAADTEGIPLPGRTTSGEAGGPGADGADGPAASDASPRPDGTVAPEGEARTEGEPPPQGAPPAKPEGGTESCRGSSPLDPRRDATEPTFRDDN